MLERLFKLSESGTTVRTEITAGITTFLAMAYILAVNPNLLSMTGMDKDAVFVATALAAAIGCFVMGFLANYPVAQAPGMGLNAFFTFSVCFGMGYSWQAALAAVFCSGVLFILLSLFGIRELIINSIPKSLRLGISAGIGLFLAFIAAQGTGLVVDAQGILVSMGNLAQFPVVMAGLAFFLTVALSVRGVRGATLLVILLITTIGLIFTDHEFTGIIGMPPSLAPTFAQLDFSAMYTVTEKNPTTMAAVISFATVVFAFLFVDLFDTAGTLVGVAQKADMIKEDGRIPRLGRALIADSTATTVGAVLGTSNTTSYVESVAGVAAGGRTGLTAVVVGCLFLVSLFFAPLAGMIPSYATAGALFYVAILMMAGLVSVDWRDLTEAAPVVIVALMIPLTYSIAHGIVLGFISYTAIKVFSGRAREISVGTWIISTVFVLMYLVPYLQKTFFADETVKEAAEAVSMLLPQMGDASQMIFAAVA
ncbi:Adenine permease AdeQ [Vibrio stylophorae]|uniref:Adenine permease AdeQ n=1 Tax=Vibrio stylophorae TaxID=659351 RepID=A0ABN8DT91_9VIBR|nr:Adenine permease AdeQ [Vibrio stylophorae]